MFNLFGRSQGKNKIFVKYFIRIQNIIKYIMGHLNFIVKIGQNIGSLCNVLALSIEGGIFLLGLSRL